MSAKGSLQIGQELALLFVITVNKRFQTSKTETEQNLKDQDFPLYFSIIPDNGFNISALKYHGYNRPMKFFTGVKNRQGPFDWKGVYNSSVQSETFHKTKVLCPTPT